MAGQAQLAATTQHTQAAAPTPLRQLRVNRRQLLLASTVVLQQLGSHNGCAQADTVQPQQHWHPAIGSNRGLRNHLSIGGIQADYDRYAPSYDALDGGAASEALGFLDLRQQLISQASGSVLEVAVGTGLNLPLYDWSAITSFTCMDLSKGMLNQAARRLRSSIPAAVVTSSAEQQGRMDLNRDTSAPAQGSATAGGVDTTVEHKVPVQLLQADVSSLPIPDNTYDVVVDTFSLCVFGRPEAALLEIVRVLKPGGRLLLLEHSRSDNMLLGAYQGATRSLVAPISKGCDWGQDVLGMVSRLPGMSISSQQRHLAGTLITIVATKA